MQLTAPSSAPTDTSLASLLAPGQAGAATPTEGDATSFADVFLGLAPGAEPTPEGIPLQGTGPEGTPIWSPTIGGAIAETLPTAEALATAKTLTLASDLRALTATPAIVETPVEGEAKIVVVGRPANQETTGQIPVPTRAGTPMGKGAERRATPVRAASAETVGPEGSQTPESDALASSEGEEVEALPVVANSRAKERRAAAPAAEIPSGIPVAIPPSTQAPTPPPVLSADFVPVTPRAFFDSTAEVTTPELAAAETESSPMSAPAWQAETPAGRAISTYGQTMRASDAQMRTNDGPMMRTQKGAFVETLPHRSADALKAEPALPASSAALEPRAQSQSTEGGIELADLQPMMARAEAAFVRPATTTKDDITPAALNRGTEHKEAKFAEFGGNAAFQQEKESSSSDKHSISDSEKDTNVSVSAVGTGFAKFGPTMSATHSNFHAAAHHTMVAPIAETGATGVHEPLSAAVVPTTALGAVEAALEAAEHTALNGRHTVNLRFSVGGEDLAVRVDLRADEVRATFRTDSPELRTALAQEWQVVAMETGDRTLRLADPVFASRESNSSHTSGFSGDGTSQQRDAHSHSQAQRMTSEFFASVPARARAAAPSTTTEVTAAAPRLGALPTSVHLHTLA